jgi:hypothetical protein
MVADLFDVPLPSSARLVLALRDMAAVEPAAAGALALALHEATTQANALRAVEGSWASGHASTALSDSKAAVAADRACDAQIRAIHTICDGAHKAYGAAPRGQLARRALAELFPRGLRGATQVAFPEQEVRNEELIAALRHPDWAPLVEALELGPIVDALVEAQATFVAALHPADEDGADYEAVRAARRAAHRALHGLVGCIAWTLRTDEDRTAAILAPLRATIAAERAARARRNSAAGGAGGPAGAAG